MNKQELHEAFSAVHASDALMKEVLSVEKGKKKNRNSWQITRRAVACAAVVALLLTVLFWPKQGQSHEGEFVAVPGVMKAYACELDKIDAGALEQYELDSTEPFLRSICNPVVNNTSFGCPITFEIPQDYFGSATITFEISSDYDDFCKKQTLKNGESIRFKQVPYKEIIADIGEKGNFYLNVIILADGQVVGYGVVSFCFYFYCATYAYEFKTVCYPLVNGTFQNISEEFVWKQIDEYKQSKSYGEGYALIQQFYEGSK